MVILRECGGDIIIVRVHMNTNGVFNYNIELSRIIKRRISEKYIAVILFGVGIISIKSGGRVEEF